jgi:hypothetical protein
MLIERKVQNWPAKEKDKRSEEVNKLWHSVAFWKEFL